MQKWRHSTLILSKRRTCRNSLFCNNSNNKTLFCSLYRSYARRHYGNSKNSNGFRNFTTTHDNNYKYYQKTSNTSKNIKKRNPFDVLGIERNASYETVKRAFQQLAMKYHPDTATKEDSCPTTFDSIRHAYEQIRQQQPTYQDQQILYSEEQFLQWFFDETGIRFTPHQRREVVQLYRNRVKGGIYHGPHWEIARRLVHYQTMYLQKMYNHQNNNTDHNNERKAKDTIKTRPVSPQSSQSSTNNANINLRRKRPQNRR